MLVNILDIIEVIVEKLISTITLLLLVVFKDSEIVAYAREFSGMIISIYRSFLVAEINEQPVQILSSLKQCNFCCIVNLSIYQLTHRYGFI